MGWLAANSLLPFVIARYLAGRVGPMGYFFSLRCQSEHPLRLEEESLAIIANGEVFAALGNEPSIELDLTAIGPRKYLRGRVLWNVNLLALQSLQLLGSSRYFKEEWRSDFDNLNSRSKKISARYEDHRQNQNRGVKVYNQETGQWNDAETK